MTEETDTPKMGDNQPPASEQFAMAIDDWKAEASNFLDGDPIKDAEQAADFDALLDGMKKLAKEAGQGRKDEKQPSLDEGTEIDKRWNPSLKKAKLVITEISKPLGVWRQKLQDDARAEVERLSREAIEKEAAAKKAREDAVTIEQAEQAEDDLEESKKLKAVAKKIERKPSGLTRYWVAEVLNHKTFLQYVMKNNPEALKEWLEEYAQKKVRDVKADMPGVSAHERSKAR